MLGHAFGSINNHKCNVGFVHGLKPADKAVVLNILVYLRLFAHTCCINKTNRRVVILKTNINGVARGTRNIGNKRPICFGQLVYQRRFTNIWPANNSNRQHIIAVGAVFLHDALKRFNNKVKKVACLCAVSGRNGNRAPKPKRQVRPVINNSFGIINFVYR